MYLTTAVKHYACEWPDYVIIESVTSSFSHDQALKGTDHPKNHTQTYTGKINLFIYFSNST